MPETGPYPTLNERRKLGEWLACDKIRRAAESSAR